MSPRLLPALLVAVLGAAPSLAHADCTGPAGVAGQIIYNTTFSVMQYCNGTNWINMGGVSSSVTAAGSTGYVQFNTGNVLDAESALVWDKTNNRLGIGSATPAVALDVVGAAAISSTLAVTGTLPRFIEIDGRLYLWRDILALRRAQLEACARAEQAALFELVDDRRPISQSTAAGRYAEPLLFDT